MNKIGWVALISEHRPIPHNNNAFHILFILWKFIEHLQCGGKIYFGGHILTSQMCHYLCVLLEI